MYSLKTFISIFKHNAKPIIPPTDVPYIVSISSNFKNLLSIK